MLRCSEFAINCINDVYLFPLQSYAPIPNARRARLPVTPAESLRAAAARNNASASGSLQSAATTADEPLLPKLSIAEQAASTTSSSADHLRHSLSITGMAPAASTLSQPGAPALNAMLLRTEQKLAVASYESGTTQAIASRISSTVSLRAAAALQLLCDSSSRKVDLACSKQIHTFQPFQALIKIAQGCRFSNGVGKLLLFKVFQESKVAVRHSDLITQSRSAHLQNKAYLGNHMLHKGCARS